MTDAAARRFEHLGALDGLRGIAIALVVWYHLWQITWLPADVHLGAATIGLNAIPEAGFVGVDLFYFISGFVLFVPYARALCDGRRAPTMREFALRRALKIVPSYYLSIAVAIAFGWAHLTSSSDAVVQVLSHAFFVHVFSNDTYGGINGVLWSLAIEVQFYVIFPIVAWCAMRRPPATFAALAAGALAYRLAVVHHPDALHEMQQLPGTLDLFAFGMGCAYGYRAIATRAPRLAARRSLWTLVALAGAVGSAVAVRGAYDARLLPDWPTAWYAVGRLQLAAAFACVTLGSLFAAPVWQRALANPALVFLSFISYNVYLYHQLVARALLAARVPTWQGADEHADPRWGLAFSAVAVSASIAVAWIVTIAVEQPIVRARRRARCRASNFTLERM
ncbi:MAG: acyltransferase [Vulcanimicrobiaceae bacterium]